MGQVVPFPKVKALPVPFVAVGKMSIKVLISLDQRGAHETRYVVQAREMVDRQVFREEVAIGVAQVREVLEVIRSAAEARHLTPELSYYPNDRPELRGIEDIFS